MTKRFFVTGTDTEVGKTIASSALLQAANLLGFHTAGYKPVASGSELTGDGLVLVAGFVAAVRAERSGLQFGGRAFVAGLQAV